MVVRSVVMVGMVAGLSLALLPPAPNPRPKEWPCPDPDDIMPCVCTSDSANFLRLDCSLVHSNDELERVFEAGFPFSEFLEFKIDHDPDDINNQVTELRTGIFGDLIFSRIIIKGTMIATVDQHVFSNSYNVLYYLDMSNNKMTDFPFETMALYTELESLVLNGNKLTRLLAFQSNSLRSLSLNDNRGLTFDNNVFEDIPNLQNLNMEHILLKALPTNVFKNLSNIELLNFDDNELSYLDEFSISPIGNPLRMVILSRNNIGIMLPEGLTGLADDAKLDMSNNQFVEIRQEEWQPIFDQIPKGTLDLTGNPLRCGCDMAWIFLEPDDKYRFIIDEDSTCFDGTQVLYLDKMYFQHLCT